MRFLQGSAGLPVLFRNLPLWVWITAAVLFCGAGVLAVGLSIAHSRKEGVSLRAFAEQRGPLTPEQTALLMPALLQLRD